MSTVSPSRMLKLPALPTVRSSSIRREPWLTSCSRPARSSPGSTPRTPQDGRTRPVRGYERGTRSGWRDPGGGEREYGRLRGKAAQARNIRIEFARREPAELGRPPQVVARVAVKLVPVRDQDHVALSWDRGVKPERRVDHVRAGEDLSRAHKRADADRERAGPEDPDDERVRRWVSHRPWTLTTRDLRGFLPHL